jgi:dTDP-L-rhamnose 4-epimerase
MTMALVTGGAGFIGSHTVDALLARGFDVRVLDLLKPPVHDGSVPAYLPREVDFVRGDVADSATLARALRGVDVVYHMAAYQDYLTDFSTFFRTNAVGTALLYELILAERREVDLVVVASSQAVYGEGKYRCQGDDIIYPGPRSLAQLERGEWDHSCPTCGGSIAPDWTDEAVMHPHNPYALSKRDQDDFARLIGQRYGIPTVCFRYSIVQGPRQSFRNAYSGALRAFVVCVLSGAEPVLFEDGSQLRDYVSVHDVVRANMLPLECGGMHGRSFNVGGQRRVTVRALCDLVLQASGATLTPSVPGMFRLGDTRHVFSDVSALCAVGWSVQVDLAAIVREYLDWAAAQPDLANTYAEAEARMRALQVLRSTQRAARARA